MGIVWGGGNMFTPAKMLIMLGRWFKNALTNGNFANGITGWNSGGAGAIVTAINNVGIFTGNGISVNPRQGTISSLDIVTGKIIYITYLARVTNNICGRLNSSIQGSTGGAHDGADYFNPVQDQWYRVSTRYITPADLFGKYRIVVGHYYTDTATADGKVMEVQNVMLHDLTAIFGAGNEPTKEWCDANIAPFVIY